MEGKHFDQLIKRLGAGSSRRHVVGGVIGTTAALLTGAAVLKAKPGKGKAKGKTKTQICHYQGTKDDGVTPKYKVLKLGKPGADKHLENHEQDTPFVDCCPGDECPEAAECFTASCVDGECTTTPDALGTPCEISPGVPGTCDGAGNCI